MSVGVCVSGCVVCVMVNVGCECGYECVNVDVRLDEWCECV